MTSPELWRKVLQMAMKRQVEFYKCLVCFLCLAIIAAGCERYSPDKSSEGEMKTMTRKFVIGHLTYTAKVPEEYRSGGECYDKDGIKQHFSREEMVGSYLELFAYGWQRCLADAQEGRELDSVSLLQGYGFMSEGDSNGYYQCRVLIEKLRMNHDEAEVAKIINAAIECLK